MSGRLFAVGDVHGCVDELDRLIGALRLRQDDTVVFIGDYIDRGPDSRGVIDLLGTLASQAAARTVFLRGNHEDMCLSYLGRGGRFGEVWLRNGGAAALHSYGVAPRAPVDEALASIGPAHLAWLEQLATSFATREYLFVHAGVRPGVRWEEQYEEDLLWIRDEFVPHVHDLGRTVIFGHTPLREVLVDEPYKIGIDTGCVYGRDLTAIELRERVLYQVRRGEHPVHTRALGHAHAPSA